MYFYRLGHCTRLSLAEIRSVYSRELCTDPDLMYGFCTEKLDINLVCGLVFGGPVLKDRIKTADDLAQGIWDFVQDRRDKGQDIRSVGLSLPKAFGKRIIAFCHEIGIKHVNLQIDGEPNFGHFKSRIPWLILAPNVQSESLEEKYFLGQIDSVFNQDIFRFLDTGLPGGGMKRGLMNLKLAGSMLNLINWNYSDGDFESKSGKEIYTDKILWDPFCGQGGILTINSVLHKKAAIGTDIERTAIRETRKNLNWLNEKFIEQSFFGKNVQDIESQNLVKIQTDHSQHQTKNINFVHLEKMDASRLAEAGRNSNLAGIVKKQIPDFDFKNTVIVTEGTLGPVYSRVLPSVGELHQNLSQTKALWQRVLLQAAELKIEQIVFTLPFYRLRNGEILRLANFESILPDFYELAEFGPEEKFIDYFRPQTMVGHEIRKVVQRTSF